MELFPLNQKGKLHFPLQKDIVGFQNSLGILDGHSWFSSIPLSFQLEIITAFWTMVYLVVQQFKVNLSTNGD